MGRPLYLADVWTVGGSVGTDFGSDGYEERKVAYDVGVNRTLGDKANVDLRYHHSNLDPQRGRVDRHVDF